MNIVIPVHVYWQKVLKHLWVKRGGDGIWSSSQNQDTRALGKTRLPLRHNLTTIQESGFFDSARSVRRLLFRIRQQGFLPEVHDRRKE